MPKISTKSRLVGKDRLWHVNWVRQREIGHKFPLGFSNQFHKNLYSSIYPCDSWDHSDSLEGAHHGGVFNLEFSPDGSLLVAACEKKSFLIFDSLSRKQIHAVDNAHVDCVNCVRFLDSRIFVTCSDDKTVALWDARNLKSRIRTLYGHSNWVKNVEYSSADGLLVTSGFDGSIYSWDINSYAESGFTLKRLFHTNGLMRTRLTPDASKMVICTTSGYLMIIHDLDLHKLSQDLHGFKPNMYRLMQQSQTTIPSASMYTHLFSRKRKRNRIEFVSDFPVHDDAEVVSSLQIHPQGWCALSRNISHEEVSEWTCVHDIQDCEEPEEDADTNYDTEDDSTIDDTPARPAQEETPSLSNSNSNSDSEDNDVAGAARVGGPRTLLHRRERGFRGFVRQASSSYSGPSEDRDAFDFQEGLRLSSSRRNDWHPVRRLDRHLIRSRPTGRLDILRRMRSTYRISRSNDGGGLPENENPPSGSDAGTSRPGSEEEPFNAPLSSWSGRRNASNQSPSSSSGTSRNRSASTEAGTSSNSPSTSPAASAASSASAASAASVVSAASAASASSAASARVSGSPQRQAQARPLAPRANNDNQFQNMELQVASSDVWEALVAIRAARAGRESGNIPRSLRMSELARRFPRSGDPRFLWHQTSRLRDNDLDNGAQRQDRNARQGGDNEGGDDAISGRNVIVGSRSSDFNRRRRAYHSSDPLYPYCIPRNQKIHQNIQRLTHFIEEPNVGKGFIKELCFSSEGRIMCSPFGYGVRLLAFSPNCAELSTCVPEDPPVRLFELTTNICHADYVVSSKFSPRHCQLVSGCLKGKIVWHLPVL